MPCLKSDAPPGTPDERTIESLLGARNYQNKATALTRCLHELTEEEKTNVGLVKLGKRCTKIPGDPFGVLSSWAGNIAHHQDERMVDIMEPMFERLRGFSRLDGDALLESIKTMLARVPNADVVELAKAVGDHGSIKIAHDHEEEVVVGFRLQSKTVHLMQCRDIDLDQAKPFGATKRHCDVVRRAKAAFDEPQMSTTLQQEFMATTFLDMKNDKSASTGPAQGTEGYEDELSNTAVLGELRSESQERFWLHLSRDERDRVRQSPLPQNNQTRGQVLSYIRANWPKEWNNGAYDVDYFYHYLKDKVAAESVWELVDSDIVIVTDCKRRVVFASIEGAAQLLFGPSVLKEMNECIDLFSFFVPMPRPETKRHVVDRYIQRIHPELDPSKATVTGLPQAKMAVAHFGCWSAKGDPNGKRIIRTLDSRFGRNDDAQYWPWELFEPHICPAVLGKATEVLRLLVAPLDPAYYDLCRRIFRQLPPRHRLETTADVEEDDFLSLFAVGVNAYTQRHRDTKDMHGGLAGLLTLGSYTGGHLCLPQLGLKTRYAPGACAVLRGDKMEHLVADYTGPRYFVIGTNHESVKRHALRKMHESSSSGNNATGDGTLPPLPPPLEGGKPIYYDEDNDDVVGFPIETPCVQYGHDEHDEPDRVWTNEELHEAAALSS
ncbi:hypothetical protein PG991_008118 [Apiospora marii]|uniref:Uncharacterized protein n=1 Tax=Apiospora marii TaxID=335849 RepID=A0ABR1RVD7_9PEZI